MTIDVRETVRRIETSLPVGFHVTEVWDGVEDVLVFIAAPAGFDGQSPRVIDKATGNTTYPGSAADPSTLVAGRTRLPL